MDFLEFLKSRRTVRKYKDEKIPREVVERIAEAAGWAPSAHNTQPWKILAIDDKDRIGQIADLLEKKADSLFSGFNVVMRDTAKNLKNARSILLVYSDGKMSGKFAKLGKPYSEIGNIFEIQSIACAIANMQLYSHSLNLGMAWYGMALFCEKEINDVLGRKGRLMALVSLGYPKEAPKAPSRKPIKETLEFAR